MDTDDTVLWDVTDGVATITFNRPEAHNAQNPRLEQRYLDLLVRADDDRDVRAVIVTGAGRSFCVGGDAAVAQQVIDAGGWAKGIPHPMERFAMAVRKPVVAAINGGCAGVGLVYAATCDVRFAARGVKIATSFSRRGCVAERGLSWMLPRLIGHGHASDLLLSGRAIVAEEAERMGLVNRVVERDQLMDVARTWASDVAANCSPSAMATIKRQLLDDTGNDLSTALAQAGEHVMTATSGEPDFREGFASFRENRPAAFQELPPLPSRGGKFTLESWTEDSRG
ncbi:enoyl-CoA hydratase-related protein [Streptomyces sp. GQFP]|uniref:enoyl-CoA hydratase-related protein n=1 Tax=Streptomyces sp. GQFP TaxID=2907545 RepID=UPI001F44F82E|nr:enoyl-CoA hydratase-related protein [Streptomyces sp. GQFP]UIX29169.1 enoyl-CoA hydratase-related protein [Streptomyces sp. GQFP]